MTDEVAGGARSDRSRRASRRRPRSRKFFVRYGGKSVPAGSAAGNHLERRAPIQRERPGVRSRDDAIEISTARFDAAAGSRAGNDERGATVRVSARAGNTASWAEADLADFSLEEGKFEFMDARGATGTRDWYRWLRLSPAESMAQRRSRW